MAEDKKPNGPFLDDEIVGLVGEPDPKPEGVPEKDWKPSRGRVGGNGNFTPGFVKERVQETYYVIALSTSPFLPMTAKALYEVSEDAAKVAEEWAQSDPKFREFILKLLKTSHGLRFAMANAPVAMAAFAEIKSRKDGTPREAGKGGESGGTSSSPGFSNPPDPKSRMYTPKFQEAKPDAQGFTYSVPPNAVI